MGEFFVYEIVDGVVDGREFYYYGIILFVIFGFIVCCGVFEWYGIFVWEFKGFFVDELVVENGGECMGIICVECVVVRLMIDVFYWLVIGIVGGCWIGKNGLWKFVFWFGSFVFLV